MGKLIDGKWRDSAWGTNTKGAFQRATTVFRSWVTPDGSAGPSGDAGFRAEAGRYHLYVSRACPWAHRTMIFRELKGLQSMVDMSVVNHFMGRDGWTFDTDGGACRDRVGARSLLYEVYQAASPNVTCRVTVPVLWDTATSTIVNNESSEIIRMFNSAFDSVGAEPGDFYPEPLRAEIDAVNERVYDTLNNGVYKCGFARTQAAYEAALEPLFATLDWLEERLSRQRYLVGDAITEADWRLFTTLVRFDAVYVGHFKTNRRRIIDYANLWAYTRELYQRPGVAATVDMHHIKQHYFRSHTSINPLGVVPAGPDLDFDAPHRRG